MTTVLVCGAIANKYLNGGNAWTRLQWVLGLQKLGFDVHFVEEIERDACVNREGEIVSCGRRAPSHIFASYEILSRT